MRSSKPRSRSNKNRNRSPGNAGNTGNIMNRVFDSSGPEGKVRGTPQQIIDKYNQLARDAQLAGDRVATENFQQHAEHYLRLLATAQREQDSRREQQEQQNRERQAERDRERAARQERESNAGPVSGPVADKETAGDRGNDRNSDRGSARSSDRSDDPGEAPQPDVIEPVDVGGDSGLVETPETAAKSAAKPEEEVKKPKPRSRRKPKKPEGEEAKAAE